MAPAWYSLSASACLLVDEAGVCACASQMPDRKSTRLNSSHSQISYAVFCLKKKKNDTRRPGNRVVIKLNPFTYLYGHTHANSTHLLSFNHPTAYTYHDTNRCAQSGLPVPSC